MKKKPLLFALLALAIVTSLTAGTLAVYTKSVDLAGEVAVKKFAFSAQGGTGTVLNPIKLAPTESQKSSFSVSNFEGQGTQSEVPLNYTITVDISKAKDMIGLTAELRKKGSNEVLDSTKNGSFTYVAKDQLDQKKKDTHEYEVTLTWVDDKDANQSTTAMTPPTYGDGLKISVTATQALTSNSGNGNGNGNN